MTEESQKLLGFLVFVEDELSWYWSFSPEEMRGLMEDLEAAFWAEEDSLTGEI